MGILKRLQNHIKLTESKVRIDFGVEVSILNYDSWGDCPDCSYDSTYRRSSKPNCETCNNKGKIPVTSTHVEQVLEEWITDEKLQEMEVGLLKAGDVILRARIESQSYFENAVENKIKITVGSVEVLPIRVESCIVDTQCEILCTRSEKPN